MSDVISVIVSSLVDNYQVFLILPIIMAFKAEKYRSDETITDCFTL